MSRNNEERFGVHTPDLDSSIVPPMVNNSANNMQNGADPTTAPLSFSVPTEIVTIPSQGKYYPEGHALHGVEEVEIRHMTAKDEDTLNSKSLLKKGTAIDVLLQSMIVDKNIKVKKLTEK